METLISLQFDLSLSFMVYQGYINKETETIQIFLGQQINRRKENGQQNLLLLTVEME